MHNTLEFHLAPHIADIYKSLATTKRRLQNLNFIDRTIEKLVQNSKLDNNYTIPPFLYKLFKKFSVEMFLIIALMFNINL